MVENIISLWDRELSSVNNGIEILHPFLVSSVMGSQVAINDAHGASIKWESDAGSTLVTLKE